ncbi:sulfotransferase family protein [Streptomyces sp. NPDC051684]|uniref:sulfotransferase family protein n=1 Tax=Streptomyces sp. NPDC051684 TaxID=3365670 RepID=UPI003794AE18
MSLMRNMNRALTATTGLQVRRAPKGPTPVKKAAPARQAAAEYRCTDDPGTDRLLGRPVFIMSPVRSGSTLLRMLLDAHPRLHAPHELHIRRLEVGYGSKLSRRAMDALDLSRGDLEHLLWDRVLHRELTRSGKDFIVEKTPSNAFAYQRIRDCWPDARFVFLLRHPVSIARSWHESDPDKRTYDEACTDALRYMKAVDNARKGITGGHTLRYEEITADPEGKLRTLCTFLGVDFEPSMLEYGARDETQVQKGLGDWRDKIRSGSVQAGRELPEDDEIPEVLRPISKAWGYLK